MKYPYYSSVPEVGRILRSAPDSQKIYISNNTESFRNITEDDAVAFIADAQRFIDGFLRVCPSIDLPFTAGIVGDATEVTLVYDSTDFSITTLQPFSGNDAEIFTIEVTAGGLLDGTAEVKVTSDLGDAVRNVPIVADENLFLCSSSGRVVLDATDTVGVGSSWVVPCTASTVPGEIQFAASRLAASYIHSSIFNSSVDDKDNIADLWERQAMDALNRYVEAFNSGANSTEGISRGPKWFARSPEIFDAPGISGEGNGLQEYVEQPTEPTY